ncbi:NAD(P)H-dependent glycerol-3-phosphate dehydrogenase [Ghiorsea bivora]|uniref:NAD(P)H-dependent glycerol-3-phosphate dehydrogenase n=1 Tax=Ghiorsea bivora TaxID=1485545 RepID=UPI000571F6C5|nr:NAD(P)H-dependent glycerol-3-phosphate dehydrogenase [Ghiorsea bivora]
MSQHMVTVWGAGSWGTALAMVLAKHGRKVYLITRNQNTADTLNQDGENKRYLNGLPFPPSLQAIGQEHPDLPQILQQTYATVLALPCAVAETALIRLREYEHPIIAANKGINPDTLERVDELLIRFVGKERTLLLSGPSFAAEVAAGKPTAITLAAIHVETAKQVSALFEDSNFRIYTSNDVVGVALGGALKNVIAIAAGIAEGMHLGHNAMAALVTRGIAEISRITEACGGKAETMSGLSGLGDLLLTCTGSLSRNRKMGMALASGLSVEKAREYVGQVVEGEKTATAAVKLAEKHQIDMPITQSVYDVLQGNASPKKALQTLLERPEKHE